MIKNKKKKKNNLKVSEGEKNILAKFSKMPSTLGLALLGLSSIALDQHSCRNWLLHGESDTHKVQVGRSPNPFNLPLLSLCNGLARFSVTIIMTAIEQREQLQANSTKVVIQTTAAHLLETQVRHVYAIYSIIIIQYDYDSYESLNTGYREGCVCETIVSNKETREKSVRVTQI